MRIRGRPDRGWTPVETRRTCERHLILGDVHCGKRSRWRRDRDGLIACGGCRQLAVRADQ